MVSDRFANINGNELEFLTPPSAASVEDLPMEKEEPRTVFVEATNQVVEMPEPAQQTLSNALSGGYDNGKLGLELLALRYHQISGGTLTEGQKDRITQLNKALEDRVTFESLPLDVARASMEQTPQLELLVKNITKNTAIAAGFLVPTAVVFGQAGPQAALPEELVTVPAALALSGKIGAISAVPETSYMLNSAEAADEFLQLRDKFGNPIDEDLAMLGGHLVGLVNAGVDIVPFGFLAKALGATKSVNLLKKSGGHAVITKGLGKRKIKEILIDIANFQAAEQVAEVTQESIKIGMGETLKHISDQEFESTTLDQFWDRIKETWVETAKAVTGFSVPMLGVRGAAEAGRTIAAKKAENEIQEQNQKLIDTLNKVGSEGIEGTSTEATSFVAQKMINGEELTTTETQVGQDLLEEARARLAEEEGVAIEVIEAQRQQQQEAQIEALTKDVEDIKTQTLIEIEALQQDRQVVDSDVQQRLQDLANLLKEKKQTTNAEDLALIDRAIKGTEQELSALGIETDAGPKLAQLKQQVRENRKIDQRIAQVEKRAEKRIARLEAKKKRLEESPPALLADKLKTFRQGLRKGKVLQKKETKAVQNEVIKIINESGLTAKDKAKFVDTVKNIQTIEQFDAQIKKIQQRAKKLAEQDRKKKATKRITKLLSKKHIKPKKQDGKPVGKFTPEIQRLLDVLHENITLPRNVAIERLQSRLENVTEVPSPGDALINMMLGIAASKRGKKGDPASPVQLSVAELEKLADDLATLVAEGRIANKNTAMARLLKITDLKAKANTNLDLQGPDIETIDETTIKHRMAKTLKNIKASAYGWYSGYYDVPDIVFKGQRDLVETLRIGRQISKEKGIVRIMSEALETVGMEAFGFTKSRQFTKQMARDAEKVLIGEFINARGKKIKLQMTKQEMRKLWMEWQDPTLHETLMSKEGNGYTQAMIDTINTEFLTDQDRAFAQAQLDLYKDFYNQVNEVYRRVYMVDLPFNEFYSPIARKTDTEFTTDEFLRDINYRQSVAPGGLKDRVKNIIALKTQSDIGVFQRHVAEMAHFIAFQEKVQELQAVYNNATIKDKINQRFGEAMSDNIDFYMRLIIRGGPERAGYVGRFINTLNSNFAVSVLAGKPALAAKQLTSFIAAAGNMPIHEFTAHLAHFGANIPEAVRTLGKSELMQERGVSIDRDIASLGRTIDWKFSRQKQKFDNFLMTPIRAGDRAAIYAGGWTIYRHALKQGKTKKEAMVAFEEWVATTQQSRDLDQLSRVQGSSPFIRTVAMFTSAPAAYLRAEMRAIRQWKRGDISVAEASKKLALYHFILPNVFQFVSDGFEFDEDTIDVAGVAVPKNTLRASVIGPLNGFAIFGDIVEGGVSSFIDEKPFFDQIPNYALWLRDVADGMAEAAKSVTLEDFMEAVADIDGADKIARGAGRAVGAPVDFIRGVADGMEKAEEGDVKGSTFRYLGWPASVVNGFEDDTDRRRTRKKRERTRKRNRTRER